MRAAFLTTAFLLALGACGQPLAVSNSGSGVEADTNAAAEQAAPQARPVRVGELGPNFAACAAAGTTRHLKAGEGLPVRSAPFDNAKETGAVPGGARFFVCTRSHDQKWLGIVYDETALAQRCGVSEPLPRRRDYEGPCRSGWVHSAFVKLVAGVDQPTESPLLNASSPEPVASPAP